MPRPLTSRPTDLVYFIYFTTHVAASLIIDLQALIPESLVPSAVRNLVVSYVRMSSDPLIGGALGLLGNGEQLVWFRSFLWLEMLFQLPVFVLGARALWKDSQSIYLLLLIYGASAGTTTFACLATILSAPLTSATLPAGTVSITTEQRQLLLWSYLPYCVIPFYMTVDMANRVSKQIAGKDRQVKKMA